MSTKLKKSFARTNKKREERDQAIDRPFDPAILRRADELAPRYGLIVQPVEDGYTATVLELPNVLGYGETLEACIKETGELLRTMLAFMIERGEQPPAPASEEKRTEQVNVRLTPTEKHLLEDAARRSGFRGLSDFIRNATLTKLRGG